MEKKACALSFFVAMAFGCVGAHAVESGLFQGRYFMRSATADEPPPGEKLDRLGIEISGEAAKAIYDAMPSKEKEGSCGNGISKTAGKFECFKAGPTAYSSSTEYFCVMGVMLDTGEPEYVFDPC